MHEIHVKIAEVQLGREGDILKATLGSCVGIVFIWKEQKICGLAHCFLPESLKEQNVIGARYVNQAIISLITLMKINKVDFKEISVYLAGAGNMMKKILKSNTSQVGKNNEAAARKYLEIHGFKIVEARLGYNCGSKIKVNCTDFTVEFLLLDELSID